MRAYRIMRWTSFLFAGAVILVSLAGCVRPPEKPAGNPKTWVIEKAYLFTPTLGLAADGYIRDLMVRLAARDGDGAPVSREEFAALLDRPESREVYADQLIKVATPRSVQIQNQAHQDYLHIFMQERRQKAGIAFLRAHAALLTEAENRYGVDRRDIVSILMWESGLGEFTGNLRVFNVLMAQLLFLEPAQAYAVAEMVEKGEPDPLLSPEVVENQRRRFDSIKKRCVDNLVALLRNGKANGIDPLEQRGSWGGAIGYPQFMPASMPYAVDGDGDGVINLHTWPDAIMSVANYLRVRGKYGPGDRARRAAIHSYNPIDSYVDGVIAYADAIWARYKKGE